MEDEGLIDARLAKMSPGDKLALLAGRDQWSLAPVESIGLGSLKMTDGPNGARGSVVTGGALAVCFPCGTALGASWDIELTRRVGAALGDEARSKGAHVLLGPTVNLHRSPLGGRDFECFAEDPHLSARMAVAYVGGVQSRGVAACVKHLTANDSEFERFSISSDVMDRPLRELYLVPFEAALLEGGAWAVMPAYNRLNGTHCSEHSWLLTTLLREEWAWDGTVVSDWYGTHTTAAALVAGLDIEMPGPPANRGPKLAAALEAGEVDLVDVDRAARRVLLLAERTGVGPPAPSDPERFDDDPSRTELAREVAAAGTVLLRNSGPDGDPLLPVAPAALRRVAVIGPNADMLHAHGGGSSQVSAPHLVTPLEGIEAALGPRVAVVFEEGCPPATLAARLSPRRMKAGPDDARPGLLISYFANRELRGDPAHEEVSSGSNLAWLGGTVPGLDTEPGGWSARLATVITPVRSGVHHLQVRTCGRVRVLVDGEVIGEEERPTFSKIRIPIDLQAGADRHVVVELVPPEEPPGLYFCELRLESAFHPDMISQAVAAAASADLAVVVVGFDSDVESEGRDRRWFDLPDMQVQLIRSVCAANPRTVVVVNTGAVVAMEWADEVPALLQVWCPGQEGGHALADVLFGLVDPGGRLPTTVPCRLEDTPAYLVWPGEAGHAPYAEGLFVGYRWYDARRLAVRFPFGFGLSYGDMRWGEPQADRAELVAGQGVTVSLDLTNAGARAGTEVVQVYVADRQATLRRPDKELKAFAKVRLEPGESRRVNVTLPARAFACWDPTKSSWWVEEGHFDVLVAASAADIRGSLAVRVSESGAVG
jgi:beta-glucosidase